MEEAYALPRTEAKNASLQRHVFFSMRRKSERGDRFCHASCRRLACSGSNATEMILPLSMLNEPLSSHCSDQPRPVAARL